MPAGAVYVGRPTRWGNPYLIEEIWVSGTHPGPRIGFYDPRDVRWFDETVGIDEIDTARLAVAMYRRALSSELRGDTIGGDELDALLGALEMLRGKDLACWCPLDAPCHADVLLEVANQPRRR